MAHTLSTHEIARLVGSQSFSRGERYARNGHVTSRSWFGNGTQLFGNVQGSNPEPYSVTVSFTLSSTGAVLRASGVCTCPMKTNCKHVAALLITSASAPDASQPPRGTGRALGDRRMPVFESTPEPPAPPAWQTALGAITRQRDDESTATALALQFDLLEPAHATRFTASRGPQPQRLGARPMVMGKKSKWIRGNITWDNLSYLPGSFVPEHRKILSAIYALYSAGSRFYTYADQWIHLDGFANRALWELLGEAQASGLPLVSTNATQSAVVLSTADAALELDINRTDAGLTLTPLVELDTMRLQRREFGFIGEPAHGIFTWSNAVDLDDDTVTNLTLAPLAHRVSAEMRALATAQDPLLIPVADEPAFVADYYPTLRQQLTLTSHDGSFTLPESPRAVLSLDVTHQAGHRVELLWQWRYLEAADGTETPEPDADTAHDLERYRLGLWRSPSDTGYRDDAAEAAILQGLGSALSAFPTLAPEYRGHPRLNARSSLEGSAMITFLDTLLPALRALPDLRVSVAEGAPSYREADEAPVISLATSARADSHDWFNLDVTVSIDGEEIPYDELFRALASEQELMILATGTYFNLDRPELHQLRHLIEEARGLQDVSSDSLGLSRFQADLWEELQQLGVVAQQAATWRSAIAGLTDATQIDERPLSPLVHATLRGYQQAGFDWLSFLYDHGLGGVLADDMGLGKTLQAIALIAHARDTHAEDAGPRSPFLVVAPTSVVSNWATECARFAPGLTVATVSQTAGKRGETLESLSQGADVVITSYTLFRLDFDEYNGLRWAGLLLDEAQFVKNHQAKAHQCARRLNTPFKLAITGTPMENNLMELWSLLSITAPGLFPSPSRFTDYYRKPIETDGDSERLGQLRRRIRPFMLRRTKDQVAGDLPEKQEQVLELDLHPRHRKVYDMHLARERQKVLGLIDNMNANRFEIFRSLTMLRQLSLDASLYDKKYDSIPSTKLDALLELLEDTVAEGHRTLIFSQFTQYLGKARDRLDAAGISYSYLDGKTRNRAKAISDFKDGDTSVFLISLKAGGFGLNLTEADYVILLDPWWNPATEAQAVDRVHRIGQTKHVMVYRLVSKDTIEEKVMALKATKARLFESVMTDGAARATALTASDIRELLA
ncbi:DEAD/DEAH box helicase [Cryobacterium psychrophilum]|uniref:Helicase n=1 Tax=Cryobacterium psychrophilum TaxID=41988 RepID=A0A4Y8KPS7_9MICO|nr:DEAD/DEAH box helicase [Cryobacterium psychrophilum]TDW30122.1 SNF2 family DNA or RNA helicase [Cryobacterium psychrophilum]TFD79888.1 helicase [Cryobacterium psychrophilum]